MIRLQKNESPSNLDPLDPIDELNLENLDLDNMQSDVNDDMHKDSMRQNNLDFFSNEVLKTLIDKNIPALPSNYQAFFEQMLNNCDLDFQKKIHDLMEVDVKNDDRNIQFEKNIHLAFAKIKELLKCTSSIYKNFLFMNEAQHKLLNLHSNNESEVKLTKDIKQIQGSIDKQVAQLKILYQQCNKVLENINTNTMYDSKFDVYNKRYFITLVQEEALAIKKFNHVSTVLMMVLPYNVMRYLNNDQMAIVVMKTMAKLLLKTSRRSDMIGYIGNGIFGMLLKHSDIFSSKKASERLIELLKNTNIFLGNNEITLDLNIGIAKITPTRSAGDSLNYAIAALHLAQKTKVEYVIYKEDIE